MSSTTPLADIQNLAINGDATETSPFPAATKQAAGLVNGVHTDVASIFFADKILITISQGGRLSQWVRHMCSLILATYS
jgi:proteasome assembly chaperone 3